jgi:hypothetical protein
MYRNFPRGHMHIDTEIKEVDGDPIESSADEFAKDETYKMSPMAQSENSDEDEIESHDSGVWDEAEEEERMVEGIFNPRSHRRDPFHPSPAIRVPHKSLRYHVTSYKCKGATKQVKKLRKVDPRSRQRDASDYMFHTQF